MEDRDRKLQAAVRSNDWQQVKHLLESGADPDAEGPFGAVLLTAMLLGQLLVARLLVEAGADVNVVDDRGWTPLHWAAKAGDPELFRLMVEADGNLLALDKEGNTPLDVLSEYRHEHVLDIVGKKYPKEFKRWRAERPE